MRIFFTGGSGKAGKHVVQYLVDKGHQVLNIDTKPLDNPKVRTLITDITDSGQVFNAFTTHFGFDGYDEGAPPKAPDAIVHFAAVPRDVVAKDLHPQLGVLRDVAEACPRRQCPQLLAGGQQDTVAAGVRSRWWQTDGPGLAAGPGLAEIKALEERYSGLWRLYVFVPRERVTQAPSVIASRLGFPSEHAACATILAGVRRGIRPGGLRAEGNHHGRSGER